MTTNAKNIEFLQKFDLTSIESKLYLTLLEIGPSTVLDLSKHAKIKRPTTHLNIENLIQKGLVTQTKKGNRRKIIAESPEKLSFILDQKKWKLDKIEDSLPSFIMDMKKNIPKKKKDSKVDVRYFEGKKSINILYKQLLKKNKRIYSFVNVNQIRAVFPNNIRLFKQALRDNKELKMWEILEDSDASRKSINKLHNRYFFRFLPKHVSISNTDLMIYSNKVLIIHIIDKQPQGILIESKSIAKALKTVHQILWQFLSQE